MEKQTAVEFAVEKLEKLIPSGNQLLIGIILNQAKEMEKQQIMDAVDGFPLDKRHLDGEQYYNQTYKKP
jgi:hypothetical protein